MGTEWNQPKAQKWTHNLPSQGIRRLNFIDRNPGVFGRNVIPEIRKITFLDRIPEKKGISFDISREKKSSVMACLSKDKRDLYIGADGGINAADICSHLFEGLKHIEQIVFPWDSFHTDLTTDFSYMFKDCMSLKALSVTSFRTSKGFYFNDMFSGCKSLESLELGNFYIHQGEKWGKLFDKNCNAYWFRASPFVARMFSGCESLSSLDLSSFDTTCIDVFTSMFENCKNLQTLRLSSRFVIRSDAKTDNMFTGCEKLDKSALPKAQ
jgi:surface protein